MRRRFTLADGDGGSYSLHADMPVAGGNLVIGTGGKLANHDADIFDPDNSVFFVNNFNDVSRDLYSVFGEWTGPLAESLQLEIGARYTRVEMDAGTVDGTPAQMMPAAQTLRDSFNNSDRARNDDNLDLAARLNYALNDDVSLLAGVARKTRSPSYQERYLWLPLQSTGGLADGNNYVGDIGLDPEVTHEIELGFDWRPGYAYFAPRLFYRHIDDYIQGTPATNAAVVMQSTMAGDPTPLQFSNVDARIYGLDAEWGAAADGALVSGRHRKLCAR
ncbi:MAG: TonB-dependent receptor [Gammaproteobacteria bacterium]|nr:TonB-dependent receptor [Gammaproteobacteria bacterium]